MRLPCVNPAYQIHIESSMWYDLQKDNFLTTYLKVAKTEVIVSIQYNNRYFSAIASILFDAFSCSMFDF